MWYSRRDRLLEHLESAHGMNDGGQLTSRFFCPFECKLPPFHTMKLLLHHCESVHENSLGTSSVLAFFYLSNLSNLHIQLNPKLKTVLNGVSTNMQYNMKWDIIKK